MLTSKACSHVPSTGSLMRSTAVQWPTSSAICAFGSTPVSVRSACIDSSAPGANRAMGVFVEDRHQFLVRDVRLALWLLFGAVAAVLVIACANLASLTVARTAERRHELAVRTAVIWS